MLKEAIDALELKVTGLEERLTDYETRNVELSGVVEGKDRVIGEILAAIIKISVGLCPECAKRLTEVTQIQTRHTNGKAV
jgi:hypothetical protein